MNAPLHTALAVAGVLTLGAPLGAATRDVDEHHSADPNGTVEVIDVAGSVNITGWNRPEVQVTGHVGDKVQSVEVSGPDNHLTIRVVLPEGSHWGGDASARLSINVPQASALNVSLVNADLVVSGVSGTQQLRTISGDITTQGGGSAHINTVSGTVHGSLVEGGSADIVTISGDVTLKGAGGDVSVSTMSGDGHLSLGALDHFRLRTVSGDFLISSALKDAADFDAESTSGDVRVTFTGAPAAQYELQSLSGDIVNCTGPQATQAQYGPGSRLSYKSGDGAGQVRLTSTSGDLSLCAK